MKSCFIFLLMMTGAVLFSSCEKVIGLDLEEVNLVYVDAFITTDSSAQTIKLLQTNGYLNNAQPTIIPGATITVTDVTANATYNFTYSNGAYNYVPAANTAIGFTGHAYRLHITYNGETFTATDTIKPVPQIDSLTYKLKPENAGQKEGYYATFFARDFAGTTDYYWIKALKNGMKNGYINDYYSIDGAFDAGIADGAEFIYPIREGITSFEKPYVIGDTVTVILRSMTQNTYSFIQKSIDQIVNGGLFARVLENVPGNVQNINPVSTTKIYGWFGTVAQKTKQVIIR